MRRRGTGNGKYNRRIVGGAKRRRRRLEAAREEKVGKPNTLTPGLESSEGNWCCGNQSSSRRLYFPFLLLWRRG